MEKDHPLSDKETQDKKGANESQEETSKLTEGSNRKDEDSQEEDIETELKIHQAQTERD